MSTKHLPATVLAPHSWDLENWPAGVYPGSESRARYLLRAYRGELVAAGALTRIGREIVVLGAPYVRWLASRVTEVPDFVAGPHRSKKQQRQTKAEAA